MSCLVEKNQPRRTKELYFILFFFVILEFSAKLGTGTDAVSLQHDVPPIYVALCALHKLVITKFDIVR